VFTTTINLTRGATSSSFRGGNFHEILFDDVFLLIQQWYNFFANGHRQSYHRNISENENFSVLIKTQTSVSPTGGPWIPRDLQKDCRGPMTFVWKR